MRDYAHGMHSTAEFSHSSAASALYSELAPYRCPDHTDRLFIVASHARVMRVTLFYYPTLTIGALGPWQNCSMNGYPIVIQGGMGAGVSDWRLARAVSATGQLGVVSGTAL